MLEKLKEKITGKSEEDKAKESAEAVKAPLHPNVVKTLEDQEIKRKALAKAVPESSFNADVIPTSAGYSQNGTNGSIQPDGQPAIPGKTDSDDPDFQLRKEAQEKSLAAQQELKEKEAEEKAKVDAEEDKKSKAKKDLEEKEAEELKKKSVRK